MKRLFTIFLLLLVLLTLCSCNDTQVDLNALLDDVNAQCGFDNMVIFDDISKLSDYYVIDENEVESFAGEIASGSSEYNEIVFIKAVDEDAAKEIKTRFFNRCQTLKIEAKSYDPEQYSVIENSEVFSNGLYVSLIISSEADSVKQIYDSYFNK
ncbi:MAG: DUF4358 domain-containing protein [Ruminococcus sp.]|nr:DUF4358 domain-containing protein [Ruminococcus sp.]